MKLSNILRYLTAQHLMLHLTPEEEAAAAASAKEKEEADKAAAEAKRLADEQAEKDKKKGQPSDAEAKLLKEVMEKKDAIKKTQEALEAANKKLKDFDGIDPVEIRKLMDERKAAEEKKLAAQGEWEALKKQMNEAHQKDISAKHTEIQELANKSKTLSEQIANLTVGNTFAHSKFIQEELALTTTKARVVYGAHFDYVDGKVVGFDKPAGEKDRTMLVDGKGEALAFEDAISKIVEADPDHMLRSKAKPGAGSGTQSRGGKVPETQTKVTGRERIVEALKARKPK
jgi:hypothetical protein